MKKNALRALIEIGFIMALFYSNLLMSEFVRHGQGFNKNFFWALANIITLTNFIIALVMACFTYLIVEYLRNKFFE